MRAEPRHKPISLEAATLLTEGKVIEAIKLVRASENLGLKQAKQRIDAHIAADPILRVQIESQQRAARWQFFRWFLLVDALIAVALIYYLFYMPR